MKRILTILLFFAMFIAFGQQVYTAKNTIKNELLETALQTTQWNLTQGIDTEAIFKQNNMTDFSNIVINSNFSYFIPSISTDNNYFGSNTSYEIFYNMDFATEPFDGQVQVLVMGEPLPSTTVSLILSVLAIGSILYLKKNQKININSI